MLLYHIDRLTVQSGGSLNGEFLRQNLFDAIHLVVAPLLVGGEATATLIDGESITSLADLSKLKALKLTDCQVLADSYLQLKYEVLR